MARASEKIVQNETEAISQGAYDDSIYNSPNLGGRGGGGYGKLQ